jgi:hypothetical protein
MANIENKVFVSGWSAHRSDPDNYHPPPMTAHPAHGCLYLFYFYINSTRDNIIIIFVCSVAAQSSTNTILVWTYKEFLKRKKKEIKLEMME